MPCQRKGWRLQQARRGAEMEKGEEMVRESGVYANQCCFVFHIGRQYGCLRSLLLRRHNTLFVVRQRHLVSLSPAASHDTKQHRSAHHVSPSIPIK